jgi:RNA polymerase sigma factor FliA
MTSLNDKEFDKTWDGEVPGYQHVASDPLNPESYLGIAKAEAYRFYRKIVKITNVEFGDLLSEAYLGVLKAICEMKKRGSQEIFRTEQTITFVRRQIRWVMYRSMEKFDIKSRDERHSTRLYLRAETELTKKLGRHPEENEMAAELGISIDELREFQEKTDRREEVSYDYDAESYDIEDVEALEFAERIERKTDADHIKRLIAGFPDHQIEAICLRMEGKEFPEIGNIIGCHKDAVGRMVRKNINKIKQMIGRREQIVERLSEIAKSRNVNLSALFQEFIDALESAGITDKKSLLTLKTKKLKEMEIPNIGNGEKFVSAFVGTAEVISIDTLNDIAEVLKLPKAA